MDLKMQFGTYLYSIICIPWLEPWITWYLKKPEKPLYRFTLTKTTFPFLQQYLQDGGTLLSCALFLLFSMYLMYVLYMYICIVLYMYKENKWFRERESFWHSFVLCVIWEHKMAAGVHIEQCGIFF